ncbi:MAG: PAS domain S-box protein [Rhodospirillaceae bacterium]|nr:PAS domain S-box protein [Rhodospirillaceae bacterium]
MSSANKAENLSLSGRVAPRLLVHGLAVGELVAVARGLRDDPWSITEISAPEDLLAALERPGPVAALVNADRIANLLLAGEIPANRTVLSLAPAENRVARRAALVAGVTHCLDHPLDIEELRILLARAVGAVDGLSADEAGISDEVSSVWRRMFDSADRALTLLDEHGQILAANRAAIGCLPTGHHERIVGQSFGQLPWWWCSPEIQEALAGLMRRALTGEAVSIESRQLGDNGEVWHYEIRLRRLGAGGDLVARILVEGVDVSRRKKSELELERLRSSAGSLVDPTRDIASFRKLYDEAAQPIAIHRNWRLLYFNRAFLRLLGFEEASQLAPGANLLEFIAPTDRARLRSYARRRATSDPTVPDRYECRLLSADGATTWIEFVVGPVEWNGDDATQIFFSDISARKAAERALGDSEERYRVLAEGDQAAIIVHRNFKPLYANTAFARLHGFADPMELMAGVSVLDMAVPRDRDVMRRHARTRGNDDDQVIAFEYEVARSDGQLCWVEVFASTGPWRDRPATIMMVHDITEKKVSEEALREAEQSVHRMGRAIEVLDQPFVLWDDDDRLVACNTRFRDFVPGGSEACYVGALYADLALRIARSGMIPDAVGREDEWVAMRQRQRDKPEHALQIVLDDGRVMLLRDERLADGGSASIVVDISEAQRQADLIKASEARYAAMFKAAGQAVMTFDGRGRVVAFNPAAERLFGYSTSEIIGESVRCLLADEAALADSSILDLFKSGARSRENPGARIFSVRARDGRAFDCEVSVGFWRHGDRRFATGILRDLTAAVQLERALTRATEEADAASNAKTRFLSSVSQELRTPLNAILGFAQLLTADNSGITDEQQEFVGQISRAGDQLLALINQVLDLTRIEAEHVALDLVDVDPSEIIQDCLTVVRDLATAQGIEILSPRSGGSNLVVRADALRARQILLTLFTNAVRYNHTGGHVTIAVGNGTDGTIRISIADTGIGIPEVDRPLVFEAFERGRETVDVEGTGIGLTVARHLAKSMGGEIGFESKKGDGTTFWLELPAADLASPENGPGSGPESGPGSMNGENEDTVKTD